MTPGHSILIVRLGALGDIVHAIPAAAALRAALPSARIDWLVDAKHREILDLVTCIDRVVVLDRSTPAGWVSVTRELRGARYDAALDLQGLMKSAVLARASGAARVLGFSIWHLREKGARPFYSESLDPTRDSAHGHVIHKNLRLVEALGVRDPRIEFPLRRVPSRARDTILTESAGAPYALLNPGAAWPNKRWYTHRFGELAAFLSDVRGLVPFVLWGPGEEELAHHVIESSHGTARLAPPTRLADLVEASRDAALMVSGDTGPLHIATAVGTPVVSIFGPTDPVRNGPWAADDVSVSRFDACGCHYDRRCRQKHWCLKTIDVTEVTAAVQQRLR
ncbi:MAG TPA: glycosyltransferase family 9 protein [Vicinamibacterales bacterium]|jgi:lipopolysaccharide heptosyltransferase I|nr:glycosyltransferase family 9 protein [Vicinamibacterales bacterium]